MADDKLDLVVEISAHTQGLEGAAKQASLVQDTIESLSRTVDISEGVLKSFSEAGHKVSASLGDMGASTTRQLTAFEELQANVRSTTSALQELAQANVVAGGRNPLQDLVGSGVVGVDEAREILAIREAERVTAEQVAQAVIDAEEQKVQKVRESNDAIDQLQTARRNEELAELKAAISQRAAEEDKAFAKSKSLGEAEEQLSKARRQRELAEMRAFYKERAKLEESAQKKSTTTPGVQGGRDYGNFSVLYDSGIKARQDEAKAWSGVLQARMRDEVAAEKQAAANNRVNQSIREQTASLPTLRYALYDVSSTLMTTGAAMTGLSVAAAAAAISMDRQFADVLRTSEAYLDSTGRSADSLRSSFEDLFTSMPASWAELTEIGTLAGQLNIAKGDIAEFTELVAMFAATTDVSVEQSATAFGRLSQLLDVPSAEFQNLGSSILAVGVNSVATESQIIAISSQIASMANSAGMSAAEVFGLSSALASLGTQPELSRGVITRLFTNIQAAIAGGGERLEAFGRLANQTGADFAQSWGEDAAGALLKMMEGLGKVEQSQAALVLKDLGITASRDVPTILRLAQNSEVLAESLQVAADGYRDGTALQEQYSVISSTVSEKIQVLINNLQNFVATLGQAGGAIGGVVDVAIGLVKVLTTLIDNPITATIIGIVGAITAIGGPLLIVSGLAVRGAASFIALRTALTEAAIAGGRLTSANVAARLSLVQLAGAAAQASGATRAFGLASRTALIGSGIGVALLAIGAAWEVVSDLTKSASDRASEYFGDVSGLRDAMIQDARAAEEAGESFVDLAQSTPGMNKSSREAEVTARGLAVTLGDLGDAADTASGKTLQSSLHFGEASAEFLKAQLRNSAAFQEAISDNTFVQYWEVLGADMDRAMQYAATQGEQGVINYFARLRESAINNGSILRDDMGNLWLELSNGTRVSLEGAETDLFDLSSALGGVVPLAQQTANEMQILGLSSEEAAAGADDLSGAVSDLLGTLFETENAAIASEEAIFRLGSSMFENGDSFDYYSEAGRANLQALMSVMEALAEESGGDAQATAANYQALFDFIQRESPNASAALNLLRQGISGLGVESVRSSGRNFGSFFQGWDKSARSAAQSTRQAASSARAAREEVRTLVDYASDLAKVWGRAFEIRFSGQSTLDAITKSYLDIKKAAEDSAERMRGFRQSIEDSRRSIQSLKADMQKLRSDISIQEYYLRIAVEYGDTERAAAIEANLAKLRAELAEKSADVKKANDDITKSQEDLQKEQASGSKTLEGNSEAAIRNREEILKLVQQYQEHLKALASSGLSQAELAEATARLREDFIRQATQLGYNRSELERYASAFDDVAVAIANVPPANLSISGLGPAQAALREFQAALNRVTNNGQGYSIPISSSFNDAGLQRSARGQEILRQLNDIQAAAVAAGARGDMIAYNALIARTAPLIQLLRSGAYSSGGYTGAGGKYEPAGIVHRGEYVLPKNMVNQSTGLPYADALGRLMAGISSPASARSASSPGASSGTPQVALTAGTIQAIAHAVQPYLVLDGRLVGESASRAYSNDNTVGAY